MIETAPTTNHSEESGGRMKGRDLNFYFIPSPSSFIPSHPFAPPNLRRLFEHHIGLAKLLALGQQFPRRLEAKPHYGLTDHAIITVTRYEYVRSEFVTIAQGFFRSFAEG
jgi:hypothetical protein